MVASAIPFAHRASDEKLSITSVCALILGKKQQNFALRDKELKQNSTSKMLTKNPKDKDVPLETMKKQKINFDCETYYLLCFLHFLPS
jgi:hypothetical protein